VVEPPEKKGRLRMVKNITYTTTHCTQPKGMQTGATTIAKKTIKTRNGYAK